MTNQGFWKSSDFKIYLVALFIALLQFLWLLFLLKDKAAPIELKKEKEPLKSQKVEQSDKWDDYFKNMKAEDFDPEIHFGV